MIGINMKHWIIILSILGVINFWSCREVEVPNETPITLTDEEKSDLLFIREEEKLARDVYYAASQKYAAQIFINISSNEQKHMDEVLKLLNKYDLDDPAFTERGVFRNAVLGQLYSDFSAKSAKSLVDALEVGATIEDLEIHDIDINISRTTNADLLKLYYNLQCGSRNHIRAYFEQLNNQGTTYKPQYLTQVKLDEIIAGSFENCEE